MSNYTKTTDFAAKDAMASGNPSKAVTGTGLGLEFDNIATMSATKVDTASNATLLSLTVTGSTIPTNGIYSPAANQLGFATSSTQRAVVDANGAWTIRAPSSGVGVIVTSLDGTAGFKVSSQDLTNSFTFTPSNAALGYQCTFSLDATGVKIRTNSAARDIRLGANSSDMLTIGTGGNITISTPAGTNNALTVNGAANAYTVTVNGSAISGQSQGAQIVSGTTSADTAFRVLNQPATATFLQIFGDGHGTLGPTNALGLSWTAAGNLTQTGGATITGTLQVNGVVAAFGGAASGYVVSPNFSFQNAGATNLAVRDTTDSTEGLFRADSTGIIFGAASNHSLFIRTNNATVITVGTAGGVQFGAPTGGDKGAGTLNVAGNLYVNNVAVGTSSAVGANPTATVGTAAVNGSSANFMRADGAPAINVGMAPTWTATHIFTKTGAGNAAAIQVQAASPTVTIENTGGAADGKWWDINSDTTTTLSYRVVNDAQSVTSNYLKITRAAAAITTIALGNATDNPTYSFLGTGASTFSGTVTGLSFIPTSATVPANGLYLAAANTLGFAANSANIARMTSTAITGLGPVAAAQVDMTPDKGTFTMTATGIVGSPTVTATWSRQGNQVIIQFPKLGGTSNTTAFTITGIPAAIQPATLTQTLPAYGEDNTVATFASLTITAASGTWTVNNGVGGSSWTASGTKALGQANVLTNSFAYSIL